MAPRKIPLEEQFPDDIATIEFLNAQKPSTRNVYKQHWRRFLKFTKMIGNQILEDRQTDKEFSWEKKVIAFRNWLLNEQKISTASATTAVGTVRAFFGFHRTELKFRRSESHRLAETERKYEDYRFSRDDLHNMCKVADLQGQYVVTTGKSFGLRVGDFLKLTRGDLEPYLDRPVPISIGAYGTKKEMVKAYPFIDSDALPIIRLMIAQMDREERTASTDKILKLKSDIQLSRILRSLAAKAGINPGNKVIRFHCLRKFLIDRLSSYMSESKWKQVVGKKIPEKAYVSPDELAKHYARAMVDTCWTEMVGTADIRMQAKIDALAAIARSKGVSEATINEIITMCDAKQINKEEAIARLEQLTIEEKPKRTELNGGDCQRIVSEEELGEYLAKGWKVQAVLPSGRIVVDNEH